MPEMISTKEFARMFGVLPSTVTQSHCVNKEYCGIKPVKLPNRRLMWSRAEAERVLNGEPVKGVSP
jgi:hypothetical protein